MKHRIAAWLFPTPPRNPVDLLSNWLATALIAAVATSVQWSVYSTDFHLSVMLPLDKLIFLWILLAITLIGLAPVLTVSHLLMAHGRRRTAWGVFILGQLLTCLLLVGDLRLYRVTGHHLAFYLPFIFQPQLRVIGGGAGLVATELFFLLRLMTAVLLAIVLISYALARTLHRHARFPHRLGLLYAAPALYALLILGVSTVHARPDSYAELSDFMGALPFNLSRIGLSPRVPDRHPFENALNRSFRLSAVAARWDATATDPPPLDTAVRITRRDPPNVIVLVVDSLRRDMLDPRYMPRLYAAAQKGMVFAQHDPGVNATHMGMFAITYARYSMFYDRILDRGIKPQMPAVFNQSGYHTTYLEGHDDSHFYRLWDYVGPTSGFNDTTLRIHGDQWDAADRDILQTIPRMIDKPAQPQFVLALLSSVHFPYFYPPGYEKFQPILDPRVKLPMDMTPALDRQPLFNHYKNAVGYMDDLLGDFLDHIDLSHNLVLIVGDHGESFWEDGRISHGGPMSRIVMQVPCLFLGQGVPQRRINEPTQHVDLLPTLLHLVQESPLPVQHIDGRDILTNPPPRQDLIACPPFENNDGLTFIISRPDQRLMLYWSCNLHRLTFEGEVTPQGRLRPFDIPSTAQAPLWADQIASALRDCSQ